MEFGSLGVCFGGGIWDFEGKGGFGGFGLDVGLDLVGLGLSGFWSFGVLGL